MSGRKFEERTTLDVYHKNQLSNIQHKIQDLPSLHEQEKGLKELISSCKDDILIGQYETRLQALQKEIKILEKEEPIYNYFLKTGPILFDYYELQNRIATGDVIEHNHRSASIKPGNILEALVRGEEHEDDSNNGDSNSSNSSNNNSSKKKDLGKHNMPMGREMLLDKYLSIMDPNYKKKQVSEVEDNSGECSSCGEEMIFSANEALYNCPSCGNQEFILMDSDRPSYKDPPRETSSYAYKRINHFNELLAQFQAKESTEIPQEVFDSILAELKKERFTDLSKLTIKKTREILRKLKINKYEHVPAIIYRLNGNNAPIMNRETEEKIRHMFREIQPSFVKHCPKNRRNFLSYHYVLYKFCELLEMDEFLHCFSLLKNRMKLYDQDSVWKLICADMKWQFLRSL